MSATSLLLLFAPSASAGIGGTGILPDGTQRTTYMVGPLDITSGQNRIAYRPITGTEKPAVDGWITRIKPDLVNADGSITLYIQNESPGKDRESNWLPGPEGEIYLVLRLYWPKTQPPSILPAGAGTWQPPALERIR